MRERPVVANALSLRAAEDACPWDLLVECYRQVGVALVVSVADVVTRPVLLDETDLEVQGFELAVGDYPLHLPGRLDHCPCARMMLAGEVVGEPGPQGFRFTHVHDAAVTVPEQIYARAGGNGTRLGADEPG